MDQLVKYTFDHHVDPLANVHYADLKLLVKTYIQQEVKINWDVSIYRIDLYLLKPALGSNKKLQHQTTEEED